MDLASVKKVLYNWHSGIGHKIKYCPPEAKFITGYSSTDAQLHQFQVDSGLELTLTGDKLDVKEWRIVDNEKYMMFVLKWS